MGQSQVYANLGNVGGFIQLTKVPTMVIILFPGFSTLITESNAVSQHFWEIFCQTLSCEAQRRNHLGLRNPCGNSKYALWPCCGVTLQVLLFTGNLGWGSQSRTPGYFAHSAMLETLFSPLYSESLCHSLEKVREEETMAGDEAKKYLENV